MAWSVDSVYVASASDDKSIRIWSAESGTTVRELQGHTNFVFCVNYNPHSNLLASGGFDETVRIWDVARGRTMRVLPAHSDPVTAVMFNYDGSLLASAAMDGLVRVWDSESGQCIRTLVDDDAPVCSHVKFSPNSQFVLISTQDSTLRLWSVEQSRCVKTYTGHANRTYCIPASFVADARPRPSSENNGELFEEGRGRAKWVVSGSEDHKVYIWDLQTRQVVQVLEGHRDVVLAVAVHPKANMIASAGMEKDLAIKIWVNAPPVDSAADVVGEAPVS